MREANPRAHITRLIHESNFMGAYLYIKDADLEKDDRNELIGMLAGAVVDEISRTRRDDKERVYFLRSVLAWILRDVPGLSPLYREQLREQNGPDNLLSVLTRGVRNIGDVATGRKRVSEGIQDAADEAKRNLDDAAESIRSGEAKERLDDFLSSAESGIRKGLDQLGEFFRVLNEQELSKSTSERANEAGSEDAPEDENPRDDDAAQAVRADQDGDVEDAEFSEEEKE